MLRVFRAFVLFVLSCLVRIIVARFALLRRAAQLVVLAVGAPRFRIEAFLARVRLDLPVRAELLVVALFLRLLPITYR